MLVTAAAELLIEATNQAIEVHILPPLPEELAGSMVKLVQDPIVDGSVSTTEGNTGLFGLEAYT
jgi:hypothetical protein